MLYTYNDFQIVHKYRMFFQCLPCIEYCKLGSTMTPSLHLLYKYNYLSTPLLLFLEQYYPFKQYYPMNIVTHRATTVGISKKIYILSSSNDRSTDKHLCPFRLKLCENGNETETKRKQNANKLFIIKTRCLGIDKPCKQKQSIRCMQWIWLPH